ncbi:MAG: IMP dehydrogenase, partial [Chloroflexota bacterium]
MAAPKFKELRRAYGFDEVAIVPGDVTINPEQTNIDLQIENTTFSVPILSSAMDAVVDVDFAVLMSKLGGLAVLHLEGLQTRYDNPEEVLTEIAAASKAEITPLLQKIYSQPIKENLISQRVEAVKKAGGICAGSVTPANAKRFAPLVTEAKGDILFVQSTVTTARHTSKSVRGLIFPELIKSIKIPVVVGNCVSYTSCLELMRTGVAGV